MSSKKPNGKKERAFGWSLHFLCIYIYRIEQCIRNTTIIFLDVQSAKRVDQTAKGLPFV